jgi:predicted PurR-regulated permease PerM
VSEDGGKHIEKRGPTELRDPLVREELKKASIWFGIALAIAGIIILAQPLMLIIAGIVFAAILDGGTRLLGRVLPIARGWRLAIVTLLGFGLIFGIFIYAGIELVAQAETLRAVVTGQANRILAWAQELGLTEGGIKIEQLSQQLMGTLGRLTSAVGTAVGAIGSLLMVVVIAIFVASEPRLYERGIAWMLPLRSRSSFYEVSARMGWTMRRLMLGRLIAMGVEGVGTWLLLWAGGVPMAALLGILTGLFAFIPNIGAIISGVLMVLAGFSYSTNAGLWAIFVYFAVQTIDGYVIMPYVARRTVDLAPAIVLGAQLLFGALFGLIGLMLADPIVAMVKTALEHRSRGEEEVDGIRPRYPTG